VALAFVSQNDFVVASICEKATCGWHHAAGLGNTATSTAVADLSLLCLNGSPLGDRDVNQVESTRVKVAY
jgi:hypothetical protein